MKTLSPYAYGTVLMIIGVLVLSPDSGVLRLIDGDPYIISFWRDWCVFGDLVFCSDSLAS